MTAELYKENSELAMIHRTYNAIMLFGYRIFDY